MTPWLSLGYALFLKGSLWNTDGYLNAFVSDSPVAMLRSQCVFLPHSYRQVQFVRQVFVYIKHLCKICIYSRLSFTQGNVGTDSHAHCTYCIMVFISDGRILNLSLSYFSFKLDMLL